MLSGLDHVLELTHYQRKRIHNLKYYTWVEQQQKNWKSWMRNGTTITIGGPNNWTELTKLMNTSAPLMP